MTSPESRSGEAGYRGLSVNVDAVHFWPKIYMGIVLNWLRIRTGVPAQFTPTPIRIGPSLGCLQPQDFLSTGAQASSNGVRLNTPNLAKANFGPRAAF